MRQIRVVREARSTLLEEAKTEWGGLIEAADEFHEGIENEASELAA